MKKEKSKIKLTEICRSFSYKLALPNYSNADFFCSQKAECPEKEAEEISEALYEFCKKSVIKSVNAYKKEFLPETPIEKVKKWLTKEETEAKQKGEEMIMGNLEEEKIKEEEKLKMRETEVELLLPTIEEYGNSTNHLPNL